MIELARDVRPPDYATAFVRFALEGSTVPEPIVVSAVSRPEWVAASPLSPVVVERPLPEAIEVVSTALSRGAKLTKRQHPASRR